MKNILKILIFILLISQLICVKSYGNDSDSIIYNEVEEIDSTIYYNYTIKNEFVAKVEITHYFSINKTYADNFILNPETYQKNMSLGFNISSNNDIFIDLNSTTAIYSYGDLKITTSNKSTLRTEEISYNLTLNETIFYKIIFNTTGFCGGIYLNNTEIPTEISSIMNRITFKIYIFNKNPSNQKVFINIILPYKSQIAESNDKYIYFFGYPLKDTRQLDEDFIDKMISGNPLTLFFYKSQIGTNLSIFPYIDYYVANEPNITLKYFHEFDILNNKIIETLHVKNRYNNTLYLANYNPDSDFPYYTFINEDEADPNNENFFIPITKNSWYSLYNHKIDLNFTVNDQSLFEFGKASYPFESYKLNTSTKRRINIGSNKKLPFFVNYNLDLKTLDIFDIDQTESFYTIYPTILEIPEIFDENINPIWPKTYWLFSNFTKPVNDFTGVNGVRLIVDLHPKENNNGSNYSFYRMYSTWCDFVTKKIIDCNSDTFSFDSANFKIDSLQNEVTINTHFKLTTKTSVLLKCIFLWVLIFFIIFAGLSVNYKYKYGKIITYIAVIGSCLIFLFERPANYPPSIFDFGIFSSIFLGVITYFTLKKRKSKPVCPKCHKKSKVRYRKMKKPHWICDGCKHKFEIEKTKFLKK